MELTKKCIEQWVAKTFKEYDIVELEMTNAEEFHLKIRCGLGQDKPDNFCSKFIRKFSAFTMTDWCVKLTFPSMKRMLFRKIYICHLSGVNKSKKISRKNEHCRASINMKVKKNNRNTRKNDKWLKKNLDVLLDIDFSHTHPVRTPEAYTQLRSTALTHKKFNSYFELGMFYNTAKSFNELNIRVLHPKDYETQLFNGHINPKWHSVRYLYEKWAAKNKNYEFDSFAKLRQDRQKLEESGVYLKIIEEPFNIIVILTPISQRVYLEFGDTVCIHSYCTVETKEIGYVTTVFAPTTVGPLPIGYILHDADGEEEYQQGFIQLAFALAECCGKIFKPKKIEINNGEQVEEYKRIFPRSNIELCAYTNFNDFWSDLFAPHNNISSDDRKRLMRKFVETLNSQSRAECENNLKKLLGDPGVVGNFELAGRLEKLWALKDDWCPLTETPLGPPQTNLEKNFISIMMRIYKSVVIDEVDKYNLYTTILIFVDIMERVYHQYLIQFTKTTSPISPLFSIFFKKQTDFNILPVEPNEYLIQSLKDLDRLYTVYTDIVYCTCQLGANGFFCTHLCAVEKEFPFLPTPTVTSEERDIFKDIAGPGEHFSNDAAEECNIDDDENVVNHFIHDNDHTDHINDDDIDDVVGNGDQFDETSRDDETLEQKVLKKETIPIEIIPKLMEEINAKEESITRKKLNEMTKEVMSITESLEINSSSHLKSTRKIINSLKLAIASETSELTTTVEETPSTSKSRKRARHRVDEDATESIRDEPKELIEEPDLVTKCWGLIYKKLRPDQKLYAKKAIDDILFEATLGTLSRNSVIIKQNLNSHDIAEADPFHQVKFETCNMSDED